MMKPHRQLPSLERSSTRIGTFSLYSVLSPIVLIPLALPVLVTLFAPLDVLDRFHWAMGFVDIVFHYAPWAKTKALSTPFAQPALLAASLALVVSIYLTIVLIWQTTVNYQYHLQRLRKVNYVTWQQHLLAITVGIPILILAGYGPYTLDSDPAFMHGLSMNTRVGYALVLFASCVTASALGLEFLALRLFYALYLKDNK